MTQQSDKSGPIEAGRARAPARIYTMEGMSASKNFEDEIPLRREDYNIPSRTLVNASPWAQHELS